MCGCSWIAIPLDAMTCACVACNSITCSDPVGACGVVEHHGISCVECDVGHVSGGVKSTCVRGGVKSRKYVKS